MLNLDQIEALQKRVDALKGYLLIDQKRMEVQEDEKQTHDPDFWNDSKNAETVMKQIRSKKAWVTKFDDCNTSVEDLGVLFEFMKAGEESPDEVDAAYEKVLKTVEDLEFQNMLSADEDSLNAVMQITSGAGGTESCDWASMLMRMYRMYGDKADLKSKNFNCKRGTLLGLSR